MERAGSRSERLSHLGEIVEEVALLVRLKLEQSQVVLNIEDAVDEIIVFVDKGQLQQALLNLILNALVAMPQGGKLTIETVRSVAGKVEILVKDTGSGIPDEFREKIFDSFLSGSVGGSGLVWLYQNEFFVVTMVISN